MSSRHTRRRHSLPEGPHSRSLDTIMETVLFASKTHITDDGARSVAEGFCDMVNLFTIKELQELHKKDKHFFELIHGLFSAVSNSNSKTSRIFKDVCHNKLGKAKNELMNSTSGSHAGSKNLQDGGGFGTITLIVMAMWVIMCADLIGNPGTAITGSIIFKYLLTISGVSGMNTFIQELLGKQKEPEFPEALAIGRAVKVLPPNQGATGKAYHKLRDMTEKVNKHIDLTEEVAVESRVDWVVGTANLVSCAAEGTCSEASDTVIGMALTPLAAADAARPKLTTQQVENNEKLKSLSKTLAIEEGKWYIYRDKAKIAALQENITAVLTEINATNIQQGLVNSQPSLSNLRQVTNAIGTVGKRVANQAMLNGKVPNTLVLDSSSLVVHRPKAAVNTSEALVAQGVKEFTVKLATIAKHHPGTEVDMASIQAFGKAYDLKILAQQTVGTSTTVDVNKINKLVNKVFNGGRDPEGMLQILGLNQGSKDSEGRKVLTALITEAAANQALANGRRTQAVINAELSKVLDANIQDAIRTTLQELAAQMVSQGFKGGMAEAEKLAAEAIETSRLFGVQPNLENTDYALAVISCSQGTTCPKKPYSELRDRGELLREMSSWSFYQRFQHAKWNMFISLIFMLSTGAISDVLLTTVLSLIGVGGCLGRCLTRGDKQRVQDEELQLVATREKALRNLELERARHERALHDIRNPVAALPAAAPGAAAGVGLNAPAARAQNAANVRLLANAPAAHAAAPAAAAPGAAAGVGLIANAPVARAPVNHGPAHLRNAFEQAQLNLNVAYNASRVARGSRNRNAIRQAAARTRELENRRNAARAAYVEAGGVIPHNEGINVDGGTRRRRR